MAPWIHRWNAIWLLRPAYTRTRSFMWFATAAAGLTVRTELLGVTSIVRALKLHERFYDRLLDQFHSKAIRLDTLVALWARVVLRLFPHPVRVNGCLVLVGDGIKAAKRGKKMPAVKLLHRQSDSNKPEYIMGIHYRRWVSVGAQCVVILVLLASLGPGYSSGYYVLLRFVICAICAYLAVTAYRSKKLNWVWLINATVQTIIRKGSNSQKTSGKV